jgi:hypothetical protein
LASDQVARESIGDGQRVAIDAVVSFELAFEVSAPDLVRGRDNRRWFARVREVAALASFLDQPVTSEDITDSCSSRPDTVGITFRQEFEEFLRAPRRMKATSIKQGFNDVRVGLMRAGFRLAGTIFKARDGIMLVAVDPLIGGLPADAIVEA